MKTLNNEQRAQLTKLAESEFYIRKGELTKKAAKDIDTWIANELAKINKESKLVRLAKLQKEVSEINKHYASRGINLSGKYVATSLSSNKSYVYNGMRSDGPYKGYQEACDKLQFKPDAFERAKNSVLAIIWSMEKPFDECIKLIKDTIAKL